METWRLLDTGSLSAAENMALDETLLELKAQEKIPHTLRFLQFSNPAVLVGHHQSVEEEIRPVSERLCDFNDVVVHIFSP